MYQPMDEPSDRTTTVQALRESVIAFRDERDWKQFHQPKDLAIALAIEVAELLEHFRFQDDAAIAQRLSNADEQRAVAHELADVLHFVLLLSDALEVDLSQALVEKLAISARRYPAALAKGRAQKYTELGTE
jgi:dCTP diphosphatase